MIHAAPSLTDASASWPALSEVWQTLTLRTGYNTRIVIISTALLGVAAGVVGCFALLRKRALMADAISHSTLPGVAMAYIVAHALGASGKSLGVLLLGAAITGVLGVGCIQFLVRKTRLTEDTAIGATLSVFFGFGVVLLSHIQSMPTGDQGGLSSFIYGQTAAMSIQDAGLMAVIAALAVTSAFLLLKEFAIVCFDDDFARSTGWPVTFIDLLMMALVTVVTVAGLQAVGLILVVAILIIPAASARFWTDRLWRAVLLSAFIGGLCGYLGSIVSALLPRKPAGSIIVLTAGCIFAFSMLAAPKRGAVAGIVRLARLRLRIACEHILESLHEIESNPGQTESTLKQVAAQRGTCALSTMMLGALLRARGLIHIRKGAVSLTSKGKVEGARVARNHRLWEQYLVSYADIAPSHVNWSVDKVEHILSDELVAELEQKIAGASA